MRQTRDQWAMSMALLTAKRATCSRRQVGAVLLNERGHVLATGYNGVAAGLPHCNEVRITRLASVPQRPGPEHWQSDSKFYLDRAAKLYPDLVKKMGRMEPHSVDSSTVEGHVGVVVKHFPHACSGACAPSGQSLDACQAIHAEQNAMLQCRDVYAIHTCYVTASPCMTCTKLLLNTSCARIVFLEEYPHHEARALWETSGRHWEQLHVEL
jgi:deoxycytidylate deaminase